MQLRCKGFNKFRLLLILKDGSYQYILEPNDPYLSSNREVIEVLKLEDDYTIEDAIARFKEIEKTLMSE